MMKLRGYRRIPARSVAFGLAAAGFMVLLSQPCLAQTYPIAPQTSLRITVVQWVPSKGEYQRWDAVGGEFTVSSGGILSIPLVGTIDVSGLDSGSLAARIAQQLKDKVGLISTPDATVEILDYPPLYIVGAVSKPGEYKFRPGLTVLQALALSGGRFRATTEGGDKGQISMLGELQSLREEILRTLGRIARLQAEGSGARQIQFPDEFTSSNNKMVAEIRAQEQIIFEARRNALERQLQNLSELQNLFIAEIDVLQKKTESLDARLKTVGEDLANVKSLVERGIATVSRRTELEFAVANLQSNRLDEITAVMRARQNLSEAKRNALSLRDKHQTDVAAELQEAQANLERLRIKEDVLKKILIISDPSSLAGREKTEDVDPELSYTIVRRSGDSAEELPASESTLLMPGDVVKVAIRATSPNVKTSSALQQPTQ
ncbi:polysaccharide biosynthesis/export family protein [Microvirga thermotolerans]|uniref:Exopolysaccharide biosynthesis protein n=1 Tax=Microvirga thermotolerans TaxID=2651334 RepID=A0A5P9K1D9_9HYPH|nr:polysaccharide biosynthesis/export family protein [Microvirga thermotolerans]QFU17868.1 exopolysaccharide biosynthesis protein [Microvirga thermotolerans]